MVTLSAGVCAPDFTLPTIEGRATSLNELFKKGPVVLIFFKVSCPVCQYALPFFERLHQANRRAGASFLGISQDDAKKTKVFLNQYAVTFPVALDDPANYAVSNAYGLTNVPTMFYVGTSGEIEISSVSWSKADVEAVHEKLSSLGQQAAPTLWHQGEEVREYRPG